MATTSPPPQAPIPGLSVYIIARNEADRIGAVIDAVHDLASEIIVVDSGSQDDTVAVAKARGADVSFNVFTGYGAQKRHAENLCRGPWLFNLDADEVVSPALATEIRALFASGEPKHGAYGMPIAEQFPGEAAPHALAYALAPVRLYRKDAGRYNPSPVHDRIDLNVGVSEGRLKGRIHHRSIRSLGHQIEKVNAYTDHQVRDMIDKGRTISEWRILFEFPATFFKAYVLRRHFVRGFYGVATAMNLAIARHLRVAKAIEAQRMARLGLNAGQRSATHSKPPPTAPPQPSTTERS